jgi:hypothetical protein
MSMFLLALVRHLLTGAGMWIASKGYADSATVEQAVGAAITLVGIALSMLDKKKLLS